jgi:RNA recognition motif-containing protein
MSQKLYVGNLNYKTTEDTLKQLFSQYGEVISVNILQGRGFGFVEMATPESAAEAKNRLSGTEFDGRKLIINDARPRADHMPGDRQPGGFEKRGGFRKF